MSSILAIAPRYMLGNLKLFPLTAGIDQEFKKFCLHAIFQADVSNTD
jgi:hypothetical protein